MTEHQPEARRTAFQRLADALMDETILPAFATVQTELDRPAQQQYVTITSLAPTAAELTIARRPPEAEDDASIDSPDVPLRYGLTVAVGPQAVVVRRSVNCKQGIFLGQHFATSLTQRAIVDDVRRLWRRIEQAHPARH
jgi:hypothetical protein